MTVTELAQQLSLTVFHMPEPQLEITGGYTGDLLSRVMCRMKPGHIWVTIMSNQNVAAVAALSDAACVLLAEGVAPDEELLIKARERGINLLGSSRTVFPLCGELSRLL
ncbi:MAG: hypothetical protein H6Q60_926 [Oscillospiraceae bacterium]|nr:hypothetical protein [Oscillospiraceae bacterium]